MESKQNVKSKWKSVDFRNKTMWSPKFCKVVV